MARTIYVNGRYLPYHAAFVHVEDRGFQFGDAVYEVCEIRDSHIIDESRHMSRLAHSLKELSIPEPMSNGAWRLVIRETIRRNRVVNGTLYVQVSRGAGPRDFLFSGVRTPPSVICLARHATGQKNDQALSKGISVITVPEMRWGRCDIKTVMLLPASLAKERARAAGAQEAWFIDSDGHVLEGGSSNAWIVTHDREVITRPADSAILRGVTRMTLIDLLKNEEDLTLKERAFTKNEVQAAKEAFITSATNLVMPVVAIDGQEIGNGRPGPIARRLRLNFHRVAEAARI
ncbi:MAG: D-amino-acid transaminase [Hyphomicrobiaceae bacterium]